MQLLRGRQRRGPRLTPASVAVYSVCLAALLLLPRLAPALVVNAVSVSTLPSTSTGSSRLLEHLLERIAAVRQDAVVYRKLGHVNLMTGRAQEASDILYRATELYPRDPILALQLGDTLESIGAHEQALEHWRRAGVTAEHLGLRGLIYHPPGKQLGEEERMARAEALRPGSSNAWFEIGRIHMNRNAQEEAIRAFTKSLASNTWAPSSDLYVSQYWAHYYLALLLYSRGHLADAYLHFQACLDISDADREYNTASITPVVHRFLGIVSQRQGRPDDAVLHLSHAISLGSADDETYYWLALAEHDRKEYSRALDDISLAISKKGDVPRYYRLLAEINIAVGNRPGAIEALEQALALAPDDAEIKAALSALRSR